MESLTGEGDKKLSTAQLMELLRVDAGSRLPIAVEALAIRPIRVCPPLRVGCIFEAQLLYSAGAVLADPRVGLVGKKNGIRAHH